MISTIAATRIASKLLAGPISDLYAINDELRRQHRLPDYYLGGAGFDVRYRIANKPRYVWSWSSFGLKLAQFYLYYLPPLEGREPTAADEIVIELR